MKTVLVSEEEANHIAFLRACLPEQRAVILLATRELSRTYTLTTGNPTPTLLLATAAR
jgi:hypothetical protein